MTKYIINSLAFQVINILEANVVLEALELVLEKYFMPLYEREEKDSRRISYISNDSDILDLRIIGENIIYFGETENKTLNEFVVM